MINLHPPGGGKQKPESEVLHSRPGSAATSQDCRSMRGWETSEGWDFTGDSSVSLPVDLPYLRLQVLFAVMPPADALESLCYQRAVLAEARPHLQVPGCPVGQEINIDATYKEGLSCWCFLRRIRSDLSRPCCRCLDHLVCIITF